MTRKVYSLNGQATDMLFSVLRKLREHDVNTLVEAQLKREALDK